MAPAAVQLRQHQRRDQDRPAESLRRTQDAADVLLARRVGAGQGVEGLGVQRDESRGAAEQPVQPRILLGICGQRPVGPIKLIK